MRTRARLDANWKWRPSCWGGSPSQTTCCQSVSSSLIRLTIVTCGARNTFANVRISSAHRKRSRARLPRSCESKSAARRGNCWQSGTLKTAKLICSFWEAAFTLTSWRLMGCKKARNVFSRQLRRIRTTLLLMPGSLIVRIIWPIVIRQRKQSPKR